MADKTVTVRLRAAVGDYQRSIATAAASTATFGTSAKASIGGIGRGAATAGRAIVGSLPLAAAAAGGASIKMAMDFETSMAQIVALTGVTSGEIEVLRDRVLDLAGETGRAPQELAEALYTAASAGLDTAGAMAAVEIAARAAATGMGTTKEVVGLIASAVAAYGAENITAAAAADILTSAIKNGRAEPDEMAASLGRVLPVASQLGIGFDEVAGATAFMSNVFGSAEETSVRLNGVLKAMLDPSKQGRTALEDMGTSADALRQAIADDGLNGALEHLRTHGFAQNEEALGALFSDSRAMQGALVLLNDEAGTLDQMMSDAAASSGELDEAFTVIADTSAHKMNQQIADLKANMVELGNTGIPAVTGLLDALNTIGDWKVSESGGGRGARVDILNPGYWRDLHDEANSFNTIGQTVASGVTEIADASGQAGQSVLDLSDALGGGADAADRVAGPTATANDLIFDMAGASDEATGSIDAQTEAVLSLSEAIKAHTDPVFAVIDAEQALAEAQADLIELQESGEATVEELSDANRTATDKALILASALNDLKLGVEAGTVSIGDGIAILDELEAQEKITADQADQMRQEFRDAAAEANRFPDTITTTVEVYGADNANAVIDQIARSRTATINVVTNNQAGAGGSFSPGIATGGLIGANGSVQYRAEGGSIFQRRGTDTVPAMLTPGEFVTNAAATAANLPLLRAINDGKLVSVGAPPSSGGGTEVFQVVLDDRVVAEAVRKHDKGLR